MRIANIAGRLHLLAGDGLAVDVAEVSGGTWGSDPQDVFARWDEFRRWAKDVDVEQARPYDAAQLEAPVPRPPQVFAIGLNYRDHATETQFAIPAEPVVFTKFPAAITGPDAVVALPEGDVDWEVELVAVIGRPGHCIPHADAWDHVAGLTIGQDLSERRRQVAGTTPQFSLAKSHRGFAPLGPVMVTPDELVDRDDLELGCVLNGEQVQKGRTSEMLFDIPTLIARLSAVTPLLAGDLIFTGTPAGVGMGRTPQRFLSAGDELISYVSGIGELFTSFVADDGAGVPA